MADLARKNDAHWNKVLDDLESSLRAGQAKLVRDELRKYPSEQIPFVWASRFASLARRSGIPGIAVRNLHPFLRQPSGKLFPGLAEEKAEYVAALIELGVHAEALDLLDGLGADRNLELFNLKSKVLLLQRNYKALLHPLEQLLRQHSQERIPLVNQAKLDFATALVHQGLYDQADGLIEELLDIFIEGEHAHLRGMTLLLAGQSNLFRQRLGTAQKFIFSAQAVVKGRGAYYELQARKWLVIHNLFENHGDELDRTELKKVRVTSKDLGNWESLRDCDQFEAIATGNEAQLWRVYFGSPYPYYQKKLLTDFGKPLKVPSKYFLAFDTTKKSEETVDVKTGEVTRDVGEVELQKLPISFKGYESAQKVFGALSSDFYAPFSYGTLWSALFPRTPFHPKDSLLKVKGMVAELENWIMEHQIRIEIKTDRNTFSLASSHPIALKISAD